MAWRDWFNIGTTGQDVVVDSPTNGAPVGAVPQEQTHVGGGEELGVTGLKRYGGYVYEEISKNLQGTRAILTFREMAENEPIIGAFLFAIEMLIRGVTWDVKAASQDNLDLMKRDHVKSCMGDMSSSWTETIVENLSMTTYGWTWHEVVYKLRNGDQLDPAIASSRHADGLVGWRKMPIRSQDSLLRWEFDESGGISGLWQQAPPRFNLTFVPIEKSLLFRTTRHKNNPQGRSVLRNAYVPYYFKKNVQRFEAIGVERDLAGLPVMKVPPRILSEKATEDEKRALESYKRIVTNVRRDEQEGLILPRSLDANGHDLYDFSLLSTGGRRQFDTSSIIQRYNQEMAVTVLADFILIGHGSQGSGGGKGGTALVQDKREIFTLSISAWLDAIATVYNRYEIPRLFKLNGWPVDKLPEITYGKIESVDVTALGQYITALSGAGMPLFPDTALENKLREVGDLPLKPETDEVGADGVGSVQ